MALAFGAFELTQPFMPLYILELGASDLADAAFWSGLISGVAPLCAAVMGPYWGSLADKYGRKPMVLRALVFISVLQLASAFVPNVQWLLVTRILMGLSAGFTAMAMALAIAVSPRERMAQAIGLVQAAQIAPAAIGPLIGGLLVDTFGLRTSLMLTGLMLIVPSCLLGFMVKESFERPPADRSSSKAKGASGSIFGLVLIPGFAAALAILFVARFSDRALAPILPLYLVELDTPTAQLATITGVVVAAGALAATCSSIVYGRWARPENTRRLLIIALAGGALFSALLALAGELDRGRGTTGPPRAAGRRHDQPGVHDGGPSCAERPVQRDALSPRKLRDARQRHRPDHGGGHQPGQPARRLPDDGGCLPDRRGPGRPAQPRRQESGVRSQERMTVLRASDTPRRRSRGTDPPSAPLPPVSCLLSPVYCLLSDRRPPRSRSQARTRAPMRANS